MGTEASFGILSGESPVFSIIIPETAAQAQDTLDHIRGHSYQNGNGEYYGEVRCVLEDRLSALASEIRRLDSEIESPIKKKFIKR